MTLCISEFLLHTKCSTTVNLGERDSLPANDKKLIAKLLRETKHESGDARHQVWLKKIADGAFSFGPAPVNYTAKGTGSWKYKALGTREWVDLEDDKFKYKPTFLKSDWKHFHDALQAHRFSILHDILPEFGICAA